jgi:integrase
MAKSAKGLTDAWLRAAKGRAALYRVADGGGLCAEVHPSGAIYWRLRYRVAGKARMAGLGRWPAVSLAAARKAAAKLRDQVGAGLDPVHVKREAKRAEKIAAANTFEAVAVEWMEHNPQHLAPVTLAKAKAMLSRYLFPTIGRRPITEITAGEILPCLRAVEKAGKLETAHRLRERASSVFRWAIATDRLTSDPTRDLRGSIKAVIETNRAAITKPDAVGELLLRIDGYQGQYITRAALRLLPLVFVRPGELRHAEWSEFNLDGTAPTWTIPGRRMKGVHRKAATRGDHVVPLSRQAVEILRELRHLTGRFRLVFPGVRKVSTPLSVNTLTAALRSIGYSGKEQTAHGFRAIASTLLREEGHDPVLIEAQMAHGIENKVEAAYNRAEYIAKRRTMMQTWADYLDGLREIARAKRASEGRK